ncbi:hypothetical protein SMD44_07519 [Streptomyces alboflavus]|uniref:Uncharacterized protein n=1 Tax=Streptomyces alboflavus TaxID=67267 RepID=A0A1Z1WNN3_9ACTN|nr:hypothetical protein [Streptomyces alboflavus]ARX88033.1 hypothetical protein SMD44_07519 [Streptomyces alboflavus]
MPLTLSARSDPALRAQASALRERLLADPALDPVDVAHSLQTTRAALEHRAVVLGGDRDALLPALAAVAEARRRPPPSKRWPGSPAGPSSCSPDRVPNGRAWRPDCGTPRPSSGPV